MYCTGMSSKNALFNLPNKKAQYCKKHKTDDMIDVVNLKCKDCKKQPKYNLPGNKKGIYCETHYKRQKLLMNIYDS